MKINRGKIVKYAVIFLGIMLFFTIISNKIGYMMTPEVSVVSPKKAELGYEITASGQIQDGVVVFLLNMEKEPYVGLRDILTAEFSNIKDGVRITVEEKVFDADTQMMKYMCRLNSNNTSSTVYEGQNCTVSFSYSLGSYDLVLPKECVIRSGNTAYIYRVVNANAVTGRSNIVRLHEVKILAEDDYNVAVSDGIYNYDLIVRYFSKALNNGQQVRVS